MYLRVLSELDETVWLEVAVKGLRKHKAGSDEAWKSTSAIKTVPKGSVINLGSRAQTWQSFSGSNPVVLLDPLFLLGSQGGQVRNVGVGQPHGDGLE